MERDGISRRVVGVGDTGFGEVEGGEAIHFSLNGKNLLATAGAFGLSHGGTKNAHELAVVF